MRTCVLMLVLSLAASAGDNAEVRRLSVADRAEIEVWRHEVNFPNGFEYILPQLIVGGEWTTTLKLINRGTYAVPPSSIIFVDASGQPMNVTFQIQMTKSCLVLRRCS